MRLRPAVLPLPVIASAIVQSQFPFQRTDSAVDGCSRSKPLQSDDLVARSALPLRFRLHFVLNKRTPLQVDAAAVTFSLMRLRPAVVRTPQVRFRYVSV